MKTKTTIVDKTDSYPVVVTKNGQFAIGDEVICARSKGNFYEATHKFASLAAGATAVIYLPNHATLTSKYLIKLSNIQYTESTEIVLYKEPKVTASGTEISVYNHDTTSANTFPINLYHTPTSSENGTQIIGNQTVVASVTLPNRTQINEGNVSKGRIVSLDNKYLLTLKNLGDAAQDLYVTLEFITDLL